MKQKFNPFLGGNAPAIPNSPPRGILPKPLSLERFVALIMSPSSNSLEPQFYKNRSYTHHTRFQTQNHVNTRASARNREIGRETARKVALVAAGRDELAKPFFGKQTTFPRHGECVQPLRSIVTLSDGFRLWIQNAYTFCCARAR